MTPEDRPGEVATQHAPPFAITLALGALAASGYASYLRRMDGAAAPPSDFGPDGAPGPDREQSLPQAGQAAQDEPADRGPAR
jgi:hypothetical protein